MTPDELLEFRDKASERHAQAILLVADLATAASDAESNDIRSDSFAEAIFLRGFTSYESSLEALFFHYVSGGLSIQGRASNSYLVPGNEPVARRMVKGGFKFLSWAKPETIRETSTTYMHRGWPLVDMMSGLSQELADCERIRNKIAHDSAEAAVQFNVVQRNLLTTERLFKITPGQLLRIRHKNHNVLHLERFLVVLNEALQGIMDPPQGP